MSAIITPPTHLLNWIVVGLAIICCKVCQNIALFLLISYLFAFLMQLLSHLNASVRVYNTASVKCYSFVPSSVLLFTSIVDENGHGNCYILSVYDFQLCWGTSINICWGRFYWKAPLYMDPEAREQNGFGESVSAESYSKKPRFAR